MYSTRPNGSRCRTTAPSRVLETGVHGGNGELPITFVSINKSERLRSGHAAGTFHPPSGWPVRLSEEAGYGASPEGSENAASSHDFSICLMGTPDEMT